MTQIVYYSLIVHSYHNCVHLGVTSLHHLLLFFRETRKVRTRYKQNVAGKTNNLFKYKRNEPPFHIKLVSTIFHTYKSN